MSKPYTKLEKEAVVRDVLTICQREGCSQKKAIVQLGYKPETVSHWILAYHRGELGGETTKQRMINALAAYDQGEDMATAARKGGVHVEALGKALRERGRQPRHFHFS